MLKKHQRHSGQASRRRALIRNPADMCARSAPAKESYGARTRFWIPAFAGMTFLFMTNFALAEPACYSPAELEAEHLLRLHSELMVITVTCHVGSQGEDLVAAYTGFTKTHIKELREAEQTMTSYYENHGGDGEDKLDRLRTKLANEFGQKIADLSSQPFCDAYRDKVLAFERASNADLLNEVERMEIADKPYIEPCLPRTHIAKSNK
jgi:hypothetical protein